MQATCGLYEKPGPVTNQATIQVGSFQFAPQRQTAVKTPFLLKTSSPGFAPRAAFAGAGERPNSSLLLYTVPKGDEPHCCTTCALDVYVVTEYHTIASFENRDTIGLYGTALYGLPTQRINHGAAALNLQAQPTAPPAFVMNAAPQAASLNVRLTAAAFNTRTDADGATWFSVANAEEYTTLGNGPVVPLLVRRIVLPAGSAAVQVTLVSSRTAAYPGAVKLPLQRAGDKTFGVETIPYTGATRYPDPLFWTTVYTDSGATELVISAVPLQYDPGAHTVTLLHQLDFSVQYTAPGGGAALSGLVVDGDNIVQRGQATAAIQATATLTAGGTYTLRWQVEDAAGHPLGGGASAVTLTAGGNALSWSE